MPKFWSLFGLHPNRSSSYTPKNLALTLHYEDYSPNSQKLSLVYALVDAFTIARIHEFITS